MSSITKAKLNSFQKNTTYSLHKLFSEPIFLLINPFIKNIPNHIRNTWYVYLLFLVYLKNIMIFVRLIGKNWLSSLIHIPTKDYIEYLMILSPPKFQRRTEKISKVRHYLIWHLFIICSMQFFIFSLPRMFEALFCRP